MVRRVLLAALVVFVGLPVGFLLLEHSRGRRMLARELAELRDRGERVDIGQLVPPPPLPTSNGMPRLLAAMFRLPDPTSVLPPSLRTIAPGCAIPSSRFDSWEGRDRTDVNWSHVDAWMARHSAELDEIHAALELPSCRQVLDYSRGFNLALPHLAQIKGLVLALGVSASHATHHGDFETALADLKAMSRVETLLADEPLLISQLVRNACAAITLNRTWDLLHSREWSDEQLRDLAAAFPQASFADSALLGLEGERALFLVGIQNVTSDELNQLMTGDWLGAGGTTASSLQMPDSIEGAVELATQMTGRMAAGLQRVFARLWSFAWGDQATACYLAVMDRLLQNGRTAVAARSRALLDDSVIEQLDAEAGWIRRARTLYARGVLPGLEKAIHKGFAVDAQRELLLTDIALQRHRLRLGRFPETLDALVPDLLATMPIDPMDGRPLRYRREADGACTLWSIGENGRDDGGDANFEEPNPPSLYWWRARDGVWPKPATAEQFAAWRQEEDAKRERRSAQRQGGARPPVTLSPELMKRYGLIPADANAAAPAPAPPPSPSPPSASPTQP